MLNEALCKVLCHNICCLIQSIYELGIVATFWGRDEPPAPLSITSDVDDELAALAWI